MEAVHHALNRAAHAPRVRSGDRPSWWDASADQAHFAAWRAQAATCGVSVDRLVGALIELRLTIMDLADAVPIPGEFLAEALAESRGVRAIASAPSARRQVCVTQVCCDELPEIVLAERVVARLRAGSLLAPFVDLSQAEMALRCDAAAAAEGRTLESWAMRAGLRRAAR